MTTKFEVFLSRNYIVHIEAKNKEEACSAVEFYLGDCEDLSNEFERTKYNFRIERIKPAVNEAFWVEELSDNHVNG